MLQVGSAPSSLCSYLTGIRRMSEHASQVIELNGQLKATQERVKAKEDELTEARKSIKGLEDRLTKEKTSACVDRVLRLTCTFSTRCGAGGCSRACGGAARAAEGAAQD